MDNTSGTDLPHFTVPGPTPSTPIVTLFNWGSHGPSGPPAQKVWYWTGAWTIPLDYPLGDINVHMSFTTADGKSGTLDYPITIIPHD